MSLGKMIIEKELSDFNKSISKEWLVANGLGGYSSSTILGINTRKYHGLLIAPTKTPPFGRMLLLSKLEDEIQSDSGSFHLSANEYPGTLYPDGHKNLRQFRLDPLPTFSYSKPSLLVKKTSFMPHLTNAVVVNYKVWNLSERKTKMIVHPIVNSRDIHGLTKHDSMSFSQQPRRRMVELAADYRDAPVLIIGSDIMNYSESNLPEEARWYKSFIYREERERGYEFTEDQYCPGNFELELELGRNEFNVLAAGGFMAKRSFELLYSEKPENFERELHNAVKRSDDLANGSLIADADWGRYLLWAADSFIAGKKVIAGYHWFGCWGRDSLISLPGLTLVTGRFEDARGILLELASRGTNGFMPNWFEGETAEYNSADVPLLFIYALQRYLSYTNDIEMVHRLWKLLEEIIDGYVKGSDGVKVDEKGLVRSDKVTWMDARVGGKLVTPRRGYVVEINALWYNALRAMEAMAKVAGMTFRHVGLSDRARESFSAKFWNKEKNCLYDVIDKDFRDPRIRPNQILAVSLPCPVIEGEQATKIVSAVQEKLLTPYGLRSLERGDPDYKGAYKGDIVNRDLAYHNGTVWAWLIGPFITAYMRVNAGSGGKEQAFEFLGALISRHLTEVGIGTISELFDGDAPHAPKGCISQAWSVAEIIRSYFEDIKGIRPPHEKKYGGVP